MSTTAERTDRYPSRTATSPHVLPRQDPVVWGDLSGAGGPLSAEALAAFDRDGYIHCEGLLPASDVDRFAAELDRLSSDPEVIDRPQTITEKGTDHVRSIFEVHRSSAVFAALAADPRVADIARQILGGDVYIHQSRVNYKPGFHGTGFYWHSDFETWHTEDGMPAMRAVSASIALTDNTEFNGPLMVFPGSHRSYIVCVGETPEDNYKKSLQAQEIGTPDAELLAQLGEQGGIEAPKGRAGSVVFFDCNMMHGSNSNITPYPRSNAFFVYNSVDNRLEEPFAAPAPRPEYIGHREHVDTLPRS